MISGSWTLFNLSKKVNSQQVQVASNFISKERISSKRENSLLRALNNLKIIHAPAQFN